MWFFTKRKTINVDLFTADAGVFEYSKPVEARHFYPDWWRKITTKNLDTSMTGCAGFIDLYRHGFMIPMWADIHVQVLENSRVSFLYASSKHQAVSHPPEQAGSFMFDSKTRSMKLYSPWWAATKEDVYWHVTQPVWNQNMQQDWALPPAVLSLKHQNALHINALVCNSDTPREFQIDFGTPMMHMIPLSESKIKLHHHLVSAEEMRRIEFRNAPVTFNHSYRKKIAAKKEHGKCPM